MLTSILKSISYLFHPLLMPWMGAVYYFSITPVPYPPLKISLWLLSIIFWSVLVPLILYFILKKINIVHTIDLKTSKERIWPLLLNSIILGYLSYSLLPKSKCVELHYFILGALISVKLFSKFLTWSYKNHKNNTLSCLVGFMIGSLPSLWPWQNESFSNKIFLSNYS